jgi:hypothetical protein
MIKTGRITPATPDVEKVLPQGRKQAAALPAQKAAERLDSDLVKRLSDRVSRR